MKTKVFKSVMPVFVMLMAIGMSFATNTVREAQTAYYQDPVLGVQSVIIGDECRDQNGIDCKFNGNQLYAEIALSTPLRKLNP